MVWFFLLRGFKGLRDIWFRWSRWSVGWRFSQKEESLNRFFVKRWLFSALANWASVPFGFVTRTPGLGGRVKHKSFFLLWWSCRQVARGWCVCNCCQGTQRWLGQVVWFFLLRGFKGLRDIWFRWSRWSVGWRFSQKEESLNRFFVKRWLFSALANWASVPFGFVTRTPGLGGRVKGLLGKMWWYSEGGRTMPR